LQTFPIKSSTGRRAWNLIKGLRPTICFNQLSGIPQVSFQVRHFKVTVQDILVFLVGLNQPIIVAIDEFQQILSYLEKNTDALFRAMIQQLQIVRFLFSGSRQTLLLELFSNTKRPFYNSASPFKLEKISLEIYRDFIIEIFRQNGKILHQSLADEMPVWTKCQTYYVQHLCNRLFQLDKKISEQLDWRECAQRKIQEQEVFFYNYRSLMSKQQWRLPVAVAK